MKNGWPMVPLGEVLTRSSEWIPIHADQSYREVTVRLWGKGVTLRRECSGSEIKSDRRLRVRPNQFIASRIDARNGAFGLIPPELDGAVVTNDFPVFTPHDQKLLPQYLGWMSRTRSFVEMCIRASEGTTNRVRLKEDRFLAMAVPLPPLAEQRRIVARVESLAAKIAEAQTLSSQTADEVSAVRQSAAHAYFDEDHRSHWPTKPLGEVSDIRSGVTLGRDLRGATVRLPYLRVANVQDGHLLLNEVKEVDVLTDEQDKWQLKRGDLLLTEGGDWDKLGRGTVWENEIENCIHQNHIFRVRVNHAQFEPYFLAAVVASPYGKSYFQSASKQTTNLASINQRQLKALPVPIPTLAEQRQIIAHLDALTAKTAALKQLQSQSAAELEALLPSILDRAFRGEL